MATLVATGSGPILPLRRRPTAILVPDIEVGVLGSVVKLDGNPSLDPDGTGLKFTWSFDVVPIGSLVAQEGFRAIDEEGALVSFSPDTVGEYVVRLTVSNDHFSDATVRRISIRAILVPDGRGLVPDGKFIWSYIRDVWQQVDDREMFETLWSTLIQLVGAEMLKAYQYDFNKSIRDIQEKMQRRWLAYEPRVDLTDEEMTLVIGNECAGLDGSTAYLGQEGKGVFLSGSELVVIEGSVVPDPPSPLNLLYSRSTDNVGRYELLGANASQTGYRLASPLPAPDADVVMTDVLPTFKFQSKVWSLGLAPSKMYALRLSVFSSPVDELIPMFGVGGAGSGKDLRRGDVIHVLTGVNQGLYRILKVTGSFLEVDRAPPAASTPGDLCNIYRPVGFRLPPISVQATNTFAIPATTGSASLASLTAGRILTMGGKAYTVFRSYLDTRQAVPMYIITTPTMEVMPGSTGLAWRLPSTLYSPNTDFEALGVTTGDRIVFEVLDEDSANVAEVSGQVIGVTKNRIGVVLTTDQLTPGVDYTVSEATYTSAAAQMNLGSATVAALRSYLKSLAFRAKYWGKELPLGKPLRSIDAKDEKETPIGRFAVRAKFIIRNTTIPVDPTVVSIPALQEWISTPEVIRRDGKIFQVRGQKEFEIPRLPTVLLEGNNYVVDSEVAYDDYATFATGTDVFEVDGSSFAALRVAPGDTVTIFSPPSIAATYSVIGVPGQDRLLLSIPIPKVSTGIVMSRVVVTRRRNGTFLRITPGLFTPASPAPERLWAEVTYFDNSDTIEKNFGIMVGLTKSDFDKISPNATYRQAVAGLMFAYTRGSSIEKIRLGAQILLGLPYTEHRGVIRSIENNYRLNAKGQTIYGRILVEDIDEEGKPLGIQRVYTYPIDLEHSELSGIETNPATGRTYVVGDEVGLFAPLSKGVAVADYISNPTPTWAPVQQALRQYHSFRLRANDNIFDLREIELVSSFLRRITPSYVAFILSDVVELEDRTNIGDFLSLKLQRPGGGLGCVDDGYGGFSPAFMYDQQTFDEYRLIRWGEGVYRRRVSGPVLTDGTSRIDLPAISSALVRVGDLFLFIEGPNAGTYPITEVGDGYAVLDSPALAPVIEQRGAVLRPISAELRRGTVTSFEHLFGTMVTSWLVVESGVISDGVMFGDWILVQSASGVTRHFVVGTEEARIRVNPAVPASPTAYRVYRDFFLESPTDAAFSLVSDGASYTSMDPWAQALLDPKDSLRVDDVAVELFVADPQTLSIQPILPAGTYQVHLMKVRAHSKPMGFDFLSTWTQDTVALKTTGVGDLTDVLVR